MIFLFVFTSVNLCLSPQLLNEIQKVNFTLNTTNVWFDNNGDPSLGYDIVYWNFTGQSREIITIGDYIPNETLRVLHDLVKDVNVRSNYLSY